MSDNNSKTFETVLVDVNPANENTFSYTQNLVTNLCVSNVSKDTVEFHVDLIEPVKSTEENQIFKLLPERFSCVGVNLDKLEYGKVNDCKLAIRAHSVEHPDHTQSVMVNVSCLPRNNGEGHLEALIRYDISGFGFQKSFERAQKINFDNAAFEREGIKGELTADKKAERDQLMSQEMNKMNGLMKNIDTRFGKDGLSGENQEFDNEFANFFDYMDNFEKKYFEDYGTKNEETKKIFSGQESIDKMFKRMRTFENRFYKNFDRFLKLNYNKDSADEDKPKEIKKMEPEGIESK